MKFVAGCLLASLVSTCRYGSFQDFIKNKTGKAFNHTTTLATASNFCGNGVYEEFRTQNTQEYYQFTLQDADRSRKRLTIHTRTSDNEDDEILITDKIYKLSPRSDRFEMVNEFVPWLMALVATNKGDFQHILRLLNTNVDGKEKIVYALTKIKGVGRRYSLIVCKRADIDINKRAGDLTNEELERIINIMQNPLQHNIPEWFLNRQKDFTDGQSTQLLANNLDNKLREDLERLKKIRCNRGLRHHWGLRVRNQHTKTTGRRGRTVGVSKKKGG